MALSFDKALGIHADALQVRSRRLELLASNLANADTPNYKARDIDFRAALGHAEQGLAVAVRRTHAGHMPQGARVRGCWSPSIGFPINRPWMATPWTRNWSRRPFPRTRFSIRPALIFSTPVSAVCGLHCGGSNRP